MVEMASFSLHPSIRKARDNLAYGHEQDEVNPTIASRSGGMKSFVAEMMSPFTACWQPDITACVPQCGEDYQGSHYTAQKPKNPVVVSPSTDRTNPSPHDIQTSPITSRHSSKLGKSSKEEEKSKISDIEKPHANDVLCGRGGSSNRHLGNTHFRELVAANKKTYVGLTKKQKMLVARKIVEMIHSTDPPGRFLSKDLDSGRWYDIGLPRSLEKTSQALREKNSNDYQSDQGTEVSDVLSDMSPPYSSTSPADSVFFCSTEPADEKSNTSKTSRNISKNAEAPPLAIPPHLMHVFGPEKMRDSKRVWADYSLSRNLEQPYLPTNQPSLPAGATTPMSPPRDQYAPPPLPHPYDGVPRSSYHYHGAPPPPSHYHRYGGLHPATPPPPDYRDHYEYYPHPDSRDHLGQHSTLRAPPPLSPGHYRAYAQPGPPSTVPPPRPYVQHGMPPVGHPRGPVHPMSPYHPHPHHFDYQHGIFHGSPVPQLAPSSAAGIKSTGAGYVRSKSEVSPDRRQEWKRQRNERGTPRRLGSDASLSRAVQNSLTLEERVVGRERATPVANPAAELMSPSGTLQGRSRPRGEEKGGLSLSLAAVSSLTEKEGDAVTVLSGLAALSTAAFLKLDESD